MISDQVLHEPGNLRGEPLSRLAFPLTRMAESIGHARGAFVLQRVALASP